MSHTIVCCARRCRLYRAFLSSVVSFCAPWLFVSAASAAAPDVKPDAPSKVSLHERIDRLIEAERLAPAGLSADDAEFLRRVSLDLHGIIPTAEEAQAFLDDKAADKRTQLIDRLLASPRFVRHMATTFDVMWAERLSDKVTKSSDWYDYLYRSFADRKPYDAMVREILTADELDPLHKPAAKFFHDRDCEPNTMTRDIGRIFFGMDMQCNQCHDHPVVDDYKIGDYYGLYAFVSRTYVAGGRKGQPPAKSIAEKAEGEASFKSVFTGEAADRVAPRIPRGATIVEPTFAKGEEYVGKPVKDVTPVPKFSRRRKLAEAATDGTNELFDRNAVNRLWAHLFGRGLVHPVDFIHPDNPPTHPAVLDLLAQEFRAGKYDVRQLLRELVQTRAYQRSFLLPQPSELPTGLAAKYAARWQAERQKLAPDLKQAEEAAARANEILGTARGKGTKKPPAAVATAAKASPPKETSPKATPVKDAPAKETAAKDKKDKDKTPTKDVAPIAAPAAPKVDFAALENNFETASVRLRKLRTLSQSLKAKIAEAEKIAAYEKLAKSDSREAKRAWESVVQTWTERGEVTLLKPLPPEVFAASLMQATGVVSSAETRAKASLKKTVPKELAAVAVAERPRMEAMWIDKQTFDPLRGNYNRFIELYGESPGGGFAATLNQALFFGNGGVIDGWVRPSGDNLAGRLEKLSDPSALAEAMYMAVYTRPPTDLERRDTAAFLKGRDKDRGLAIQEMLWALLSSNEFRFNH
ncbi:MAG: DUF1549 and DUF1553 domain-containing protein [Planctomycetia bacterium]|nr:DUF1549 and DUF1553 domain-containing protein [Planctomycetia bacterium]